MPSRHRLNVAVLLATYNGSRYVWPQIRSLKDNATKFTLHWLDDHSSDNTPEAVRTCASDAAIPLEEWHQSKHLGVPGAFFRLLECVEADVYFFCDQDDIWQPGKIDATAEALTDPSVPALAFTDTLMFRDDQPSILSPAVDFSANGRLATQVNDRRLFAFLPGGPSGQTQGFTRSLRDIVLTHIETAQTYALLHDWWMYDIATATGTISMLRTAPKVLYRSHDASFCRSLFSDRRRLLRLAWRDNKRFRSIVSKHANGLLLASTTLSPGPQVDRMRVLAHLLASLDRRQTTTAALYLARLGLMSVGSSSSMLLNCVCCDTGRSAPGIENRQKQV